MKVVMGNAEFVTTEITCEAYNGKIQSVLDSEMTELVQLPQAHNLILVGGPCVYDVDEPLYSLFDQTCEEARTSMVPGDWIAKMVENGENVAMLVYGHSATDTRTAIDALLSGEVLEAEEVTEE